MVRDVSIPPSLIAQYLRQRQSDIETLAQAVTRKDGAPFALIGHRLAGSGPSYGFPELGQLGRSMLQSVDNSDFAALGEQLNQLRAWLARQNG